MADEPPIQQASRLGLANDSLVRTQRPPRLETLISPGAPPGSLLREFPPLPPTPVPGEPVTAPAPPGTDPFGALPFPNAGERIRAEDFRTLSQALRVIADTYALGAAVFGRPLGQVRIALEAQGYAIAQVMSVTGSSLAAAGDASLDDRRVVSVTPLALGQKRLGVVVTEAVAQPQRRMPNLIGLTHAQAVELMRAELGDALAGSGPMVVPNLVGQTLSQAERAVTG